MCVIPVTNDRDNLWHHYDVARSRSPTPHSIRVCFNLLLSIKETTEMTKKQEGKWNFRSNLFHHYTRPQFLDSNNLGMAVDALDRLSYVLPE